MARGISTIAVLALLLAAWLTLVPFGSADVTSRVQVNCGAAILDTTTKTVPPCRSAARVRVQEGAIAAGFAVIVLVGDQVWLRRRESLTRFGRTMRSN